MKVRVLTRVLAVVSVLALACGKKNEGNDAGSANAAGMLSSASPVSTTSLVPKPLKSLRTTNGKHHITVQKLAQSDLEKELKEFGQGLQKDHSDDIPIEILFETDDPGVTAPLEGQGDGFCGELRGGARQYTHLSRGFRKNFQSCIFLGPPPTGDLIFQPKGYAPIFISMSK
jgi:hypothetical protein